MLSLDLTPGQRIIGLKCTLNSGYQMPVISFGTYQINGRALVLKTLDAALAAGYRAIDTATMYENEQEIGDALKQLLPKYGLTREDIFITTKLADIGDEEHVTQAVSNSLHYLGLSYIDLYLIHWPGVARFSPSDPRNATFRANTWKHLIKLWNNGRGILRSIGVSNFTVRHIVQLLQYTSVTPAVNQVEFHLHWSQNTALQQFAQKNGIVLQAYSPLGGSASGHLINQSIVKRLAKKNGITPGQLLLRFALQKGYAIVVKSVTKKRIEENSRLETEISEEDVNFLDNVEQEEKYDWNPEEVV